jgi:hypothetical protein
MSNIPLYTLCFVFFTMMDSLSAAAPLTHLYFANKWQEIVYSFEGEDQTAFHLGNLFPDIRYLGEVSREMTHEANVTLESIFSSPSPFVAGTRLHAFVDEEREALVVKWKIYDIIIDWAEGQQATLLKLIEDEILFHHVDLTIIRQEMDRILEEELATGSTYSTVQKWHAFLKQYLSLPPSQLLAQLAQQKRGYFQIPPETICHWSQILPYLAQKTELLDYVDQLSKKFSEQFDSFTVKTQN